MNKNNPNDNTNNKKIIVLPYIKEISERVASTVDRSKYIIEYRTLNSLGKIIRVHKNPIEFMANNNVVYKINCNECNASYVGQTKRQLLTRIKEHRRNGNLSTSKTSVITQHMNDHSHSFDWNNIQILDTEPNYYKRSISEMLHIKEQANGINARIDTELLDESYFDVLKCLI